jgi:hypothetical protein
MKPMRMHIGTKIIKLFEVVFYFLAVAYLAAAIMNSFGLYGVHRSSIGGSPSVKSRWNIYTIIFGTGYYINIAGALFKMLSVIGFIIVAHKEVDEYGKTKKIIEWIIVTRGYNANCFL